MLATANYHHHFFVPCHLPWLTLEMIGQFGPPLNFTQGVHKQRQLPNEDCFSYGSGGFPLHVLPNVQCYICSIPFIVLIFSNQSPTKKKRTYIFHITSINCFFKPDSLKKLVHQEPKLDNMICTILHT